MDGLVATGSPAASIAEEAETAVVHSPEDNAFGIIAEGMALEAKIAVTDFQHAFIHGTVRIMTDGAALTHGFMLEDKRSPFFRMAFQATLVTAVQPHNLCQVFFPSMRIVAIRAIHAMLAHGVTVGKGKLALFINMAAEAHVVGLGRVDDIPRPLPFDRVDAAWAVTGLTSFTKTVFSGNLEDRMVRPVKITEQALVTIGALFVADEFSARNHGRNEDHAGGRQAGGKGNGSQIEAPCPPDTFPFQPSSKPGGSASRGSDFFD